MGEFFSSGGPTIRRHIRGSWFRRGKTGLDYKYLGHFSVWVFGAGGPAERRAMAKADSHSSRNVKGSGLQVPPAELDVLGVLWSQGKATARNIRETMDKYRPMSHGAVVALLTRLEAKGLVSKTKGPVGKAFIYESTRKPEPSY